MTSARPRRLPCLVGIVLVVTMMPIAAANAAEGSNLELLRSELATIDAQLRAVEVRSDSLSAATERIALDLAELEREQNLGPVKRAQLSLYRQESQRLSESREALDRERALLDRRYGEVAEDLIPLLGPAIDAARSAYEAEPLDSLARARLFRIFEGLVLERRALRGKLSPSATFLLLEISMDPDDTIRDLRRKADLLADNRDLLARLLSRLGSWKRELIEDRTILSDYLKLREENEFFNTTDPVAPSHVRDLPAGLGAGDVVPRELVVIEDQLDIPAGGLSTEEDYDRLIESVTRLEAELEDEILAMDVNQKMIEREIERRGGE